MGNIIPLPTRISSEIRGGKPKKIDYREIPEKVIAKYYEELRGGDGPDEYVINLYQLNDKGEPTSRNLMLGYIPVEEDQDDDAIYENQQALIKVLDAKAPDAFRAIKERTSRVFIDREGNKNVAYVRSTNGLIACGWYDSADSSRKGKMMACYMLYAFGLINMAADIVLYNAVYCYLPYESGVFTSVEANKAGLIITNYLKNRLPANED